MKGMLSGIIVTFIGVSLNNFVMTINGGMPVNIGFPFFDIERNIQYVPLRNARFGFLGDVIRGDTSIGDILMAGGFAITVMFVVIWLYQNRKVKDNRNEDLGINTIR